MFVFGYGKQSSVKKRWNNTQPCNCGHCYAGTEVLKCPKDKNGVLDWNIGWESCCFTCPSKAICVSVDRDDFFIGNSTKGKNPLVSAEWHVKAPKVVCKYNSDDIDTAEQMNAFKARFQVEDYTQLALIVFSRQSFKCPVGMTSCSMLLATDELGELCRKFVEKNDVLYDTIAHKYCFQYNTPDCACINRGQEKSYNTLKLSYPYDDSCWYSPCADGDRHLVPKTMSKKLCPKSLCGSFTIIGGVGGNVSKSNNTDVVQCGEGLKTSAPPVDIVKAIKDSQSRYYIYIGAAILALIVIKTLCRR